MLATTSIGAIWSSCAPEFGTRAVIDRLSQLDPAVLIADETGGSYSEAASAAESRRVTMFSAALIGIGLVVTLSALQRSRSPSSISCRRSGSPSTS